MKNKRYRNKKLLIIMIPLTFMFLLLGFCNTSRYSSAQAVTVTGYTGVLSDLMIADNFNKEDYPSDNTNTTLDIIQIAESTGGELFIYTYQPNVKVLQYELTQISLSQTLYDSAKFTLYDLKLIDSDGVFCKYKVQGIELKSDVVRYYSVPEIFRTFEPTIDTQPNNSNTITEIAIPVAKTWTACTLNGETYYSCEKEDVVLITDKYVGFIDYEQGFTLKSLVMSESCYSHFVAFSCDYKIDDLYEADVYYVSQDRIYTTIPDRIESTFGPATENYKYLKYTDSTTYTVNDWGTKTDYTWDRIQTVSEFIESTADRDVYGPGIIGAESNTLLTDDAKAKINGMQYVLRFCETSYKEYHKSLDTTGGLAIGVKLYYDEIHDTSISDVTILRLKFLSDGVVYNLGVVDNKVNGSGISDSYTIWTNNFLDGITSFWDKVKFYLIIALIVIAVIILLPVLIPFFKYLFKGLGVVFKFLWYIITAPFTFIKSLFNKGGG